jgi:hypothetical protein
MVPEVFRVDARKLFEKIPESGRAAILCGEIFSPSPRNILFVTHY